MQSRVVSSPSAPAAAIPAGDVHDIRDLAVIAAFLKITPRRVQQLAHEGVFPKGKRGRYHFETTIRGYITYLQDRAEGKGAEEAGVITQRERLAKANADRAEIGVATMRGEMVSRTAVLAALSTKLIASAELLQSIPDRFAALLASENDANAIHRVLTDEIRAAMTVISTVPDHLQ